MTLRQDLTAARRDTRFSFVVDCRDGVAIDLRKDFGPWTEAAEILLVGNGDRVDGNATLRSVRESGEGSFAAKAAGLAASTGTYVVFTGGLPIDAAFVERAASVLDSSPHMAFIVTESSMSIEHIEGANEIECDVIDLLALPPRFASAVLRRLSVARVDLDSSLVHPALQEWDFWLSVMERGEKGIVLRPRSYDVDTSTRDGASLPHEVRFLVRKHRTLYRQHALDVILRREERIRGTLQVNAEIERELECTLVPELERKRREVAALQRTASGLLPVLPANIT